MSRKVAFWCLVALNFLDYYITTRILLLGGQEGNPIVDFFIQQFGFNGILFVKAPFLILIGYVVFFAWDRVRPKWQVTTKNVIVLLNWALILLNTYSLTVYVSYQ